MYDNLSGKVIAITGASKGVGAGLAQDFHQRGAKLALCARGDIPLHGSPDVFTSNFSVTDKNAFSNFCSDARNNLGEIDLFINNAGVLEPVKPVRELEGDELQAHLDINLLGVLYGSQLFAAQVRARESEGTLINISSGAAWSGYAGWAAYCMGKAAVDRLSETLSLEEKNIGLRVYAVAPGIVDTDMQKTIRASAKEVFPMVDKFLEYKEKDAFNTVSFVAEHIVQLAFGPQEDDSDVVVRIPSEKS